MEAVYQHVVMGAMAMNRSGCVVLVIQPVRHALDHWCSTACRVPLERCTTELASIPVRTAPSLMVVCATRAMQHVLLVMVRTRAVVRRVVTDFSTKVCVIRVSRAILPTLKLWRVKRAILRARLVMAPLMPIALFVRRTLTLTCGMVAVFRNVRLALTLTRCQASVSDVTIHARRALVGAAVTVIAV